MFLPRAAAYFIQEDSKRLVRGLYTGSSCSACGFKSEHSWISLFAVKREACSLDSSENNAIYNM